MTNLPKYYGRELLYITTKISEGKINVSIETKTVYNPKIQMIAPCAGCDIVIGGNSTNSKHIYEIGEVNEDQIFSYDRLNSITIFNYCELENQEKVTKEHKQIILNTLKLSIEKQQARIEKTKNILQSI